jgi:hypothetical protein
VVRPLSRSLGPWLVAWVVVLGTAAGLAALAETRGTDWSPLGQPLSRLG